MRMLFRWVVLDLHCYLLITGVFPESGEVQARAASGCPDLVVAVEEPSSTRPHWCQPRSVHMFATPIEVLPIIQDRLIECVPCDRRCLRS